MLLLLLLLLLSFSATLAKPAGDTTGSVTKLLAGIGSLIANENEESVEAELTSNSTCLTTPYLKHCCAKVLVANNIERCCGNIPVIKNVHQERCCVNGAGISLPLATPMLCCNGLPYPKTTMKCCKTPGGGNRPLPIYQDCPSFF